MDAFSYKYSALLALAIHAMAAAGIGGLLIRSRAAVPPPPATIIVLLNLAASPEAATANRTPMPRSVAPPRPQPRQAERTAPLHPAPVMPAPETLTDARASTELATPAIQHAETDHPKTAFLTSLAGITDGTVDARITGLNQSADSPAGSGDDVDAMPVPHHAIRPLYPISARRRGETGQVVLDALIAPDGRTGQVMTHTSSGFPDLDLAAERAVKQTVFRPATRNNQPVAARLRITILFRLTD